MAEASTEEVDDMPVSSAGIIRNELFHQARSRLGLSRQGLADTVNDTLTSWFRLTADDVAKIERGIVVWPNEPRRDALRNVLAAATDAEIGFSCARPRS